MSSTQSISGGVLPWEVPTQKTAGNPHSCCWGKWRVGRGPALMKCFLLILNVVKLQFYLNMIAGRERWEKELWPKDKCTVKSMTKVRRNPRDCAPIFSIYHLNAEDLMCHDYLTAVTLFFVTLCSLPANAVLETASVKNLDIRFFFHMTTSLPISISPVTQHSHSCKLTHLYQLKLNLRLLGIHAKINTRLLAYIKTEL